MSTGVLLSSVTFRKVPVEMSVSFLVSCTPLPSVLFHQPVFIVKLASYRLWGGNVPQYIC